MPKITKLHVMSSFMKLYTSTSNSVYVKTEEIKSNQNMTNQTNFRERTSMISFAHKFSLNFSLRYSVPFIVSQKMNKWRDSMNESTLCRVIKNKRILFNMRCAYCINELTKRTVSKKAWAMPPRIARACESAPGSSNINMYPCQRHCSESAGKRRTSSNGFDIYGLSSLPNIHTVDVILIRIDFN